MARNNEKTRLAIRAGGLFSKQSISGVDSASPEISTVIFCCSMFPELGLSSLSSGMLIAHSSFHGCESKAVSTVRQRLEGLALLPKQSSLLTASSSH